jgi:hypothetical protein
MHVVSTGSPDYQPRHLMEEEVFPPTVRAADDPRGKQATWSLLPVDTSHGECSQCGVVHHPDDPHNWTTLYYQYSFYAEHDRWPTVADAMSHCDEARRQAWTAALRTYGIEI